MGTATASESELRKFGLTIAAALMVVFYLILPLGFGAPLRFWPLAVAAMLSLWATIAPASLKILHVPWMKFAHVLGRFNTTVILGLVFLLVITPTGWILRLIRAQRRARISDVSTYKSFKIGRDKQHLEKPY